MIVASAGSLQTLRLLVSRLTPDPTAAFLVVRHAGGGPSPEDLLQTLADCSPLAVGQLQNGETPEAGTLRLLPEGLEVDASGPHLHLRVPREGFRPAPCIDAMLASLAAAWGPRLIVVMLSGLGADGALGLRRVREAGGLAVAQDPASALFTGMPSAAVQLGGLAAVLEPAAISGWLNQQLRKRGTIESDDDLGLPAEMLHQILVVLQERTGIDFSRYKGSTVCRQVQRRLALLKLGDMTNYLTMLANDDQEAERLKANLLVGVTRFFREPATFAALADAVEAQMESHLPGQPLRVWVPGCASGEEAYSIAMVISAALQHPADLNDRLRLFATDLNESALAVGRRGRYPLTSVETVPADLRERFFHPREGQLEISRELRRCIVFSRHNLGSDPPFPRLDLISCRNTLIYFNPTLQDQALRSFRFALTPGGLLLLGQSETLPPSLGGFTTLNAQQRLYRLSSHLQRDDLIAMTPRSVGTLPISSRRQPLHRHDHPPPQHVALLEAMVQQRQLPTLVLDDNLDLVAVLGDVSRYCTLPQGQLCSSVVGFLREEVRQEATALLLLSRNNQAVQQSRPLQLGDGLEPVRLEVAPLAVAGRALRCLTFHPLPAPLAGPVQSLSLELTQEMARLEGELLSSQNSLRESMAELEQANEELEASAEELQASNAELVALNQELRQRGEELEQANMDLQNIQGSLSQGMVIVDRQLRILRFSPLAVRVFGLLESDRGLPLLEVPTTLPLQGLAEALQTVVNGGPRQQLEASSEEVAYLLRVLPYLGHDEDLLGAIVALTDVSELVAMRKVAEASLAEFVSLTDALDDVVWKQNGQLEQLLYVSHQAEVILGRSPSDLIQDPGWLDSRIASEDRPMVLAERQRQAPRWRLRYRWHHPDGRMLLLQETALRIEGELETCVVGTLRVVDAMEGDAGPWRPECP